MPMQNANDNIDTELEALYEKKEFYIRELKKIHDARSIRFVTLKNGKSLIVFDFE